MSDAAKPPLRRNMDDVWVAGVCSGFARRIGVEPAWIRLLAVASVVFGGFGIPVYALGWALIAPDADAGHRRLPRTGRGAVEVAVGASLLVLAALLTLRASGLWVADVLTWPMVLLVGGAALIWRTSQTGPPPSVDAPKATPRAQPVTPERVAEVQRERAGWAAAVLSRTGLGIALVVAAAFVFIRGTGAIAQAWDALLVILVSLLMLGVIFAPWLLRLVRSLGEERSERIRSQERAEVAAHLHDSVLQTLALIQKRSADPAQVTALARRQERELRAWLSGRVQAEDAPRTLRAALEGAASEVEQAHGAEVDVVAVGDAELDGRLDPLVAAAREAMLNAARHGGGHVSVYAEATGGHARVYVRDRGPGFDPASVPSDRRGISESIVGRMQRHGGSATIVSRPGEGTEVELSL